MARSEEEKKRYERDKRHQRTYFVGEGFYDTLLAEQNGCCGICGRPATDFTVSLNIDHEHFLVKSQRTIKAPPEMKWCAHTTLKDGREFSVYAQTQKQAIADLKRKVIPQSIRGLLCPGRHTGCNRLLGRVDKIDWLEKSLNYLKNPPASRLTNR